MLAPDDSDVPPAVSCATCRRLDCAGCSPVSEGAGSGFLAWESATGSIAKRLWRTALTSSLEPKKLFGELPEGSVARAFTFALLAELVAIGSLGAVAALVLWGAMPDIWLRVVSSASALLSVGSLLLGASLLMVALHALWGLCLECGAGRQRDPRFGQGLRFGLYACGWDLLTSPAGIIEGLLTRGPRGAWSPILAAVRVPRTALTAYLEQHRGFDAEARRRSMKLSVLGLGIALLGIFALGVMVALRFVDG